MEIKTEDGRTFEVNGGNAKIIGGEYYLDNLTLIEILRQLHTEAEEITKKYTQIIESNRQKLPIVDEYKVLRRLIGIPALDYKLQPINCDKESSWPHNGKNHNIRVLFGNLTSFMYNLNDVLRHREDAMLDPYYELDKKCEELKSLVRT